jgi:glycogen(starch) synthase
VRDARRARLRRLHPPDPEFAAPHGVRHGGGRYRSETADSFARHKTVFVSDFLRRAFLRAVPDADLSRARVIHNFIRYPSCASARRAGRGAGRGGAAGRAHRFRQGLRRIPGPGAGLAAGACRVTIIGDGPLRPQLEARYAGPQVRFLGWQPTTR